MTNPRHRDENFVMGSLENAPMLPGARCRALSCSWRTRLSRRFDESIKGRDFVVGTVERARPSLLQDGTLFHPMNGTTPCIHEVDFAGRIGDAMALNYV